MQRVRDPPLVRGERRGRACGARVTEGGQSVRGGGTAGRVAVVEKQDERLEGPGIPRHSEAVRGQLPHPQRLPGLGQHGRELVGVAGRREAVEKGEAPDSARKRSVTDRNSSSMRSSVDRPGAPAT